MEPDAVAQAIEAMYCGPPDSFIPARDALVKELRTQGAREAASEVGKLRRPTVAAWVVNLLVSDQPELAAQLGELAEQLREAQDQLAGEDLRVLGRQRHQLVASLVARARDLARQAGRPVKADVLGEVESSLRATLADRAMAATVLSGRLTSPLGVEGFGPPTAQSALSPPVKRTDPKIPTRPQGIDAPAELTPTQRKADERQRAAELRKAERDLEKAEAELLDAEHEHAAAEAAAAQTADVVATADGRVSWLQAQLEQATAERDGAFSAQAAASERARTAGEELDEARERVEGARAKADLI